MFYILILLVKRTFTRADPWFFAPPPICQCFSFYSTNLQGKHAELFAHSIALPAHFNACTIHGCIFEETTVRPQLSGHDGISTYPDKQFVRIWEICLNTASSLWVNMCYYVFTHCYSICNKLPVQIQNGNRTKLEQFYPSYQIPLAIPSWRCGWKLAKIWWPLTLHFDLSL